MNRLKEAFPWLLAGAALLMIVAQSAVAMITGESFDMTFATPAGILLTAVVPWLSQRELQKPPPAETNGSPRPSTKKHGSTRGEDA